MRKATFALVAAIWAAGALGVVAAVSTIQPSYDALMAMPSEQRQQALKAMDIPTHLAMSRTHIDRWLAANRARLSDNQVTIVEQVRDHLTPESYRSERLGELERQMQCELWMSDVFALTLARADRRSSRFEDVRYWLRSCVLDDVIEFIY